VKFDQGERASKKKLSKEDPSKEVEKNSQENNEDWPGVSRSRSQIDLKGGGDRV